METSKEGELEINKRKTKSMSSKGQRTHKQTVLDEIEMKEVKTNTVICEKELKSRKNKTWGNSGQ